MSDKIKESLALLQDNEENVKKEVKRILLKICQNILKYPLDPRYRKLFLSNEIVAKKLLPATGAIQCLFAIGFTEDDNGFLLPMHCSISRVQELFNYLYVAPPQSPKRPQPALYQPQIPTIQVPSPGSTSSRPLFLEVESEKNRTAQQSFFIKLAMLFQDALKYEDEFFLDKARDVLPLTMLQIQAMTKMRIIQRQEKLKKLNITIAFEDLLINEMMIWFKTKFFSWVDSPQCDRCTGECKFDRVIKSYHRKISRIEVHKCTICGDENQFPRYSDPETLLYTKKGRCGEWANCFTLFCRVANFDTRIVYDETDHVWVEVWSDFHKRWLHCDPCENIMDSPLVYERGWKKKLTYIFAFSRDEVVDVTWRYTRDYEQILNRRNVCKERSLALFINRLNRQRQFDPSYSEVRRKFVTIRLGRELAEMMPAPPGCTKPSDEAEKGLTYGSRQSGSLAWKIARGEVNDSPNTPTTPFQWTIPKDTNKYELYYFIGADTYTARDLETNKVILSKSKWRTGVDSIDGGVFRKEEREWKMVYLARLPVYATSTVTWTFVVEDKDLTCIDSVKFNATIATFHGGIVTWEIKGITCGKDKSEDVVKVLPIPNCKDFETSDLTGAMQIEISATLSGGEGEQSWQHAQLFRDSIPKPSKVPSMKIQISLKQKL